MYFAPETSAGFDTVISARLFAGVWQKVNRDSNNQYDKIASREEIMEVLANVENILIRYLSHLYTPKKMFKY